MLNKLVDAGMSIARCNFSHGTYEEHKIKFDRVKKIRKERNKDIPIMLDTKGPDVRCKTFANGAVELSAGQKFSFYTNDTVGDEKGVSITHKTMTKYVKKGDLILLGDGFMQCLIEEVKPNKIVTKVINGGKLSNNKAVAVPGVDVGLKFLSEQDVKDLQFGVKEKVDMIGASFINCANDVKEVRAIVGAVPIIAKIETIKGFNNIDEILELADGVMVARGGLGTNVALEKLPFLQKVILKRAKELDKFSIVATEMMDSMINNPRPTRAEVADVANAVLDGASAVMFSGETAIGKWPTEAVVLMRKIADEALAQMK
jgi:pyruvate kinase